jgi:hypothetical protein
MLQTKRFAGDDSTKDPYAHIDIFDDICETFKLNVFTQEEMRLKIFNQILSNKALAWYKTLPVGTTSTWGGLYAAFLTHFYPERKSYGASHMSTNFKNQPGESIINGYTRFRGLIDHCPHHELPPWLVLHTFYGGLSDENRNEVDMASQGVFMERSPNEGWQLLDSIHHNSETWSVKLDSKGTIELDPEYVKTFLEMGRVENLIGEFQVDPYVVAQVAKVYTDFL